MSTATTSPGSLGGSKELISEVKTVRCSLSNEPLIINGKEILREEDAFEMTGYAYSTKYKWWILTVVAIVQTSMNYNAAVYSNVVEPLNKHFGIHNARHGMIAFLVTYAFGCELWAPWSEEIGRKPIMQASLGLVNVWQTLAALATNWPMVLTARVLGGLSSAGGSVTLGMVADMFDPEEQQYAVAWVSLWSCLGSVVGGICGGPIEQYLPWRWNFWIQLIFGVIVQALHAFTVPETRSTILLDREAEKRRKNGIQEIYGPNEAKTFSQRFNPREILKTMGRPYWMLLTEPIVLLLSLLSGFSDALIFSFLESYGPESRLWWLLFIVPLLPIGIFGFAFVSTGPPLPWIAPLMFSVLIGMANYAIYFATIDYMVAAYGEFAASATGGNGFARDVLAGMCALYTGPMYKKLKPKNASFLLFAVAFVVCIPVYVFYWFGPWARKRSRFAQKLAAAKEDRNTAKQEGLARRTEKAHACDAAPQV
ncbi:MFS general substrate transporter [Zopfia rhizophila CBS 207.26]|uniref:MFS general substrate transporter n=1 Tax=Zopfia rhizophila CBS 207.26 TaxID=1314779 RepID=A0A6A6ESC4_9PEZI|nr:MFS general substrate transporter [Zopfia rhizophila CBS 207.26]